MKIDDILQRAGLQYDDLNRAERETLDQWMQALRKNKVSLSSVQDHISAMKNAVERELADEPEYRTILFFKVRNDKNILLKARLRNYLLLEAHFTSPEKARQAVENAISSMIPKEKS